MMDSYRRIARFLVPALLFLAIGFGCVTTEGELFDQVVSADLRDEPVDGDTEKPDNGANNGSGDSSTETGDGTTQEPEPEPEPETTGVYIESDPNRASVFVDGDYAGRTPLLIQLDEDEYDITLMKNGYYSQTYEIDYSEGDYQIIDAILTRITGYLYIAVDPPNAEITIDGTPATTGVTELGVGNYSVNIRAFGFEPYSTRVDIRERQTTEVDATLKPAKLAVSGLSVSRSILNPRNPGRLGEAVFTFDVTTYGSGSAHIIDENDETVHTIPLDRFETWSQQFRWTGVESDGRIANDGTYRVEIEAKGEDGSIDRAGPVFLEVSRKAVITYRSGWSGIAGTLYAPSAELLPASSFQVSTLAGGTITDTAGRVPAQLFIRIPAATQVEVAAQGGVIMNATGSVPLSAGISAKFDLHGAADGTSPVGIAAYSVATLLLRTNADSQTNFSGVRAGVVGTLRGGPVRISGALELAAAPYAVTYSPDPQETELTLFSYGRFGASFESGGFSAGLSGAIRTDPFRNGFGFDLPFAAGVELHWLIPGTYVALSAMAFTEFENESNYYVSYGGGIGIVH